MFELEQFIADCRAPAVAEDPSTRRSAKSARAVSAPGESLRALGEPKRRSPEALPVQRAHESH